MVQQGLKNYFSNLKYFFTPLGTIALGVVIGLSILIPGVISSAADFFDEVKAIFSDTSMDFSALKQSILGAVQGLDWNDPVGAVRVMLSGEWISETLNSCAAALIEGSEAYTVQIDAAVFEFVAKFGSYILILIAFTVLGIIGGYFLLRWLIRRRIARRSILNFVLVTLIDSVLDATLVALCMWLMTLWTPSILFSGTVSVLLFGFISLFEAYFVHGRNKVEVKQIINIKNIFKLAATNFLIFFVCMLMVYLAIGLTNVIVGLFIGIALMEIAFVVISLNAEAYVKSLAENAPIQLSPMLF